MSDKDVAAQMIASLDRDATTLKQLLESYHSDPLGDELWSTEAAFNDFARRFCLRYTDTVIALSGFYKAINAHYNAAQEDVIKGVEPPKGEKE